MSPLALLCWLGIAADLKVEWRNRVMLLSWFGAFFVFYCFYSEYDAWWYTRFLLPGYPALILGVLLIARDIPEVFRRLVNEQNRARLKWVVLAIFLGVTLSHEKRYINKINVPNISVMHSVYPASCRWADQQLPSQSLIVSMQFSGALKYYTSRPIVRWDEITPEQLPVVKKHAAEKGYQWYALLSPEEIEDAQKRLGGRWTKLGALDHISLWQIDLAIG